MSGKDEWELAEYIHEDWLGVQSTGRVEVRNKVVFPTHKSSGIPSIRTGRRRSSSIISFLVQVSTTRAFPYSAELSQEKGNNNDGKSSIFHRRFSDYTPVFFTKSLFRNGAHGGSTLEWFYWDASELMSTVCMVPSTLFLRVLNRLPHL